MFPKTASVQEIQRNYRKWFDQVIEQKEPLLVLNNSRPEVVIIEVHQYEDMQEKLEKYELELAKQAIAIANSEKKGRKLKKLQSLKDLLK